MNPTKLLCVLLALCTPAVGANAGPASTHKKPAHKKAAPAKQNAQKPVPPADTSDVPDSVWKPDPALLSKLGPEQTFGPYAMRLPIGYTAKSQTFSSDKAQVTAYELSGLKRKDGKSAHLIVLVAVAQPGFTTKNFESLLMINKALNVPDMVKSDMEIGEINGISVARQYYTSPSTATNPIIGRAFQYVDSEGSSFVIMASFDDEPYSTDTLPLCEAAVRTLRKINP